jgi:hypothetical protein
MVNEPAEFRNKFPSKKKKNNVENISTEYIHASPYFSKYFSSYISE